MGMFAKQDPYLGLKGKTGELAVVGAAGQEQVTVFNRVSAGRKQVTR